MGRTLHFEITNSSDLTEPEKQRIIEISDYFNTGQLKDVWTCENFYLDPLSFYPNWEFFKRRQDNYERAWSCINARYESLKSEDLNHLDIVRKLHDEGLVCYHVKDRISGFCKVGGNEFNASLVYAALLMISSRTSSLISLSDEGEFLLVPVLIRGGKAKPWTDRVREDWHYWTEKGFIKSNSYGIAEKQKQQANLLKKYPDYTAPENLCRQVDPTDFKDHPEYSGSQIMAGFDGEYYGLNGEGDPEKESLELCAIIQSIARKAGFDVRAGERL